MVEGRGYGSLEIIIFLPGALAIGMYVYKSKAKTHRP